MTRSFKHPRERSLTLEKRVSGVPGDEVAMRGDNLYVNGVLQDEPYLQHTGPGDYQRTRASDGRCSTWDDSLDSRHWGFSHRLLV